MAFNGFEFIFLIILYFFLIILFKSLFRTESQDTEESSSDSGSSLLSLSSILGKGERSSDDEVPNPEENLQDLLPGPSTGPSVKIKSLQEKKRKLLTNKDDDSTDTEENYTANPNQSSKVSFKKNVTRTSIQNCEG